MTTCKRALLRASKRCPWIIYEDKAAWASFPCGVRRGCRRCVQPAGHSDFDGHIIVCTCPNEIGNLLSYWKPPTENNPGSWRWSDLAISLSYLGDSLGKDLIVHTNDSFPTGV